MLSTDLMAIGSVCLRTGDEMGSSTALWNIHGGFMGFVRTAPRYIFCQTNIRTDHEYQTSPVRRLREVRADWSRLSTF